MGNSPRSADEASLSATDDTVELDMLEQTVALESPVIRQHEAYGLLPAPIPPSWILDGQPVAHRKLLARGTDGMMSMHMWDCTSGRFSWHYDREEMVHVLEGSAVVETGGLRRRLEVGESFVFPAGAVVRWTVPDYVRTLAASRGSSEKLPLRQRVRDALTAPLRPKRPPRD